MNLLKEFRPALMFLGKFLAIYFAGNILYGIFVESYGNNPDDITNLVTHQTAWVLNSIGYDSSVDEVPEQPKVALKNNGETVLNVYEGCNGINVIIVFISFLFAFGGPVNKLAFFLPAGVIVIHLFNLLRIVLLFYLALNNSRQFYYYHKYFFTATLYLVVFGLWAIWVIWFNEKRVVKTTI
ncbi:MAG: exosortase family protein XrtF [Cyclobacteriaceae bacterium]